ncbi:Unknown protein [Striga hermonthica]|uniref:Pentatricopeptide repeat-containing protein n=1 Tax=Striga hermonthica TaxID=68872 RepID=A0A9N7NNM2_STRHE|nr:Unknown protein [Striga hermonthica]
MRQEKTVDGVSGPTEVTQHDGDNLYGPWIQVPQRSRPAYGKRYTGTDKPHIAHNQSMSTGLGSRFDILHRESLNEPNYTFEFGSSSASKPREERAMPNKSGGGKGEKEWRLFSGKGKNQGRATTFNTRAVAPSGFEDIAEPRTTSEKSSTKGTLFGGGWLVAVRGGVGRERRVFGKHERPILSLFVIVQVVVVSRHDSSRTLLADEEQAVNALTLVLTVPDPASIPPIFRSNSLTPELHLHRRVYTEAISKLRDSNDPDSIRTLIRDSMEQLSSCKSENLISHFIVLYGRGGLVGDAVDLFDRMPAMGMSRNVKTQLVALFLPPGP